MLLTLGALCFTIVTVLKYKAMFANPLGYNLERFNMKYCNCLDSNDKFVFIPTTNSSLYSQSEQEELIRNLTNIGTPKYQTEVLVWPNKS